MATSSFNDKVVVTDPDIVEEMKKTLDDPNVKMIDKDKLPNYTIEQTKENARKWTPDIELERILTPVEIKTEEQVERFLDAWDKAEANVDRIRECIKGDYLATPKEIKKITKKLLAKYNNGIKVRENADGNETL